MADFGDFMAGFTGSLYQQRKAESDRKAESTEWERRQRILNDLDIDKSKRLGELKTQDGNTFKDETGAWVTETLDGNGNPKGTRKATAAEIAEVESKTLEVEDKRDTLNYRPTARAMDAEQHKADMEYKRGSLALQGSGQALERERLALARANMARANEPAAPHTIVEDYLGSPEGKMVVAAYTGTMGRGIEANRPGSTFGQITEPEQLQISYNQLKGDIMRKIAALPPTQRPKTESQLRALVAQIAASQHTALDRVSTPKKK